MIWRLTYCNKKGAEARIDIIKGSRTPVQLVEGSEQPFTLSYKLDKTDKSGHIMTSSADVEIFETETFNIDDLKTSNETELKVEYFEENILTWAGFILPDFFSREIGSPNIVRMTASDRLTAIKGITLSDLPTKVSLGDLIELCLAKTGLTLGLTAQIQLFQGSTNILDSEILSQRFTDVRGRSISCYDILMSIMVGTNSTIMQRKGLWVIYNKLEHEQRTPTVFFDKVEKGAIRTIQPVASSVGVYNEFGGSKTYPENYNFKSGGAGWAVNFPEEMSASFSSKNILGFDVLVSGGGYQPVYGTEDNNPHAVIYGFRGPLNYLKSVEIPIPSGYTNEIDIKFDINASGPIWNFGSHQRFSVFAVKGERTQVLTSSGFVNISQSSESEYMHMLQFEAGVVLAGELARVSTNSLALSGKLVDYDGLDGYSVHIRLYSSDRAYATIVNFASINFSPAGDSPKGNLYKTTQGSNFTKQHDIETTIFGDYITGGLNGYFYNYPIDDSSNLFLPDGTLSLPQWITAFDPTERPLLHHISRQKSSLFSVAHDILTANINVESFDPLAIFQDCKGNEYVVISASFDFLRSKVDVALEQIAYDNTILKRDFIYSYFGESESGIKSIGGISGGAGGGSTGGGLTPEQLEILSWWKKDPANPDTIFTEMNAYSTKELSAYGVGDGEGGGGGGSDYERLDTWADYNSSRAGWVLSAFLGNDLNTRVTNLENGSGGGGSGSVTSVGISVPTGLSVSNSPITSSGVIAIGLQTGYSIPTTVKQGQWDTAYNNNHTHSNKTVLDGITSALISNWNTASTNNHTHANKTQLDLITQSNIDVLAKLSIVNGNLQIDGNAYATGELSAYGAGTGGGGGGGIIETVYGYGNLGQTFNNANLTDTFNAYTINQINTRLVSVENGSATTVNTTGTGNAITSITKDGSVITANKDLTFSLSNHLHTGVYEPTFSKNTAFNKNFGTASGTVAQGNHTHTFASLTSKPTTLGGYGITDAVTLNTAQTITGNKTFDANITLGVNRYIQGTDNYTGVWNVDNKLWRFGSSSTGSVSNIRSERVGVGTDSPTQKLHVIGNILATGTTTTTKVIFNAAGWSMEQVGSELQLKYNNLIASRFLADGSIVGLGEITAYGAATGGEGVALLRTGGTMTGAIRWEAQNSKTPFIGHSASDGTFTIAIDGTTWQSGLSLGGGSGNLLWKGSQVLDKANTANKIEMGNGWTIEQTTSALTIKKNGVVKGTFNA